MSVKLSVVKHRQLAIISDPELRAILQTVAEEIYQVPLRVEEYVRTTITSRANRRTDRVLLKVCDQQGTYASLRWLCKWYPDQQSEQQFRLLQLLNSANFAADAPDGLCTAKPIAHWQDLSLLILAEAVGLPLLDQLAEQHDYTLLTLAVQALAKLHSTSVPMELLSGKTGLVKQLATQLSDLIAQDEINRALYQRAQAWLSKNIIAISQPLPARLLHGEYGGGQLLVSPGKLTILDLDKAHYGDPAADLGHFIAQILRWSVSQQRYQLPEIYQTCWQAYLSALPNCAIATSRVDWYIIATLIKKSARLINQGDLSKLSPVLTSLAISLDYFSER